MSRRPGAKVLLARFADRIKVYFNRRHVNFNEARSLRIPKRGTQYNRRSTDAPCLVKRANLQDL